MKNIPIIVIGTPAYSSDCRNKSTKLLPEFASLLSHVDEYFVRVLVSPQL